MDTPIMESRKVVLEVAVRNHPGVMSHVCGLFARRAFNVEGILCMPEEGNAESRIWLLVDDDARLPQMVAQVEKLEDVLAVGQRAADHRVFARLEGFFRQKGIHR